MALATGSQFSLQDTTGRAPEIPRKQAAALATGFPFALVLVAMCYSTWKGLRAARADQKTP